MKNTNFIFVLLLAIAIFSCNSKPKTTAANETAKTEAADDNDTFKVHKNYHSDGKTVKEEIEIIKIQVDGKDKWIKHGNQKNYYKNGKLQAISEYRNHKREGISYQYYENGTSVYFERPYVNSKKEGVVKKYYRSGKLMSETPYKQDMLGTGTQDYADNKENTKLTMPELKVWADDKRRENGTYIVYAKVVDKYGKTVSRVEFKDGMLLQFEGRKYEHPGLKKLTAKNNMAKITFYESTGFPQFVSLSARVVTSKGSALLLNRVHTVKD